MNKLKDIYYRKFKISSIVMAILGAYLAYNYLRY